MAGNWSVIEKAEVTNELLNPSFEDNVTDGWTNIAGGGLTRTFAIAARFGAYCATDSSFDTTDESNAISLGDTDTVTVSAYVYRTGGSSGTISIIVRDTSNNVSRATSTAIATQDAWQRVEASWTNTLGAPANVALRIDSDVDPGEATYFDGMQWEEQSVATTYVDGTQVGCEWNGAKNNGSSTRDAQSLAGGIANEFEATFNFYVDRMLGVGISAKALNIDEFAILPGGELNSKDRPPREFVLAGSITGTSLANLNANRQLLKKALDPDVPGKQPVLLRYNGAALEKEIACYYLGGLDSSISAETARINAKERVAIRFVATDPNFYEIGESSKVLTILETGGDPLHARIVMARFRNTAEWDLLGPPNVAGTYNSVEDIAIGADKTVYLAGNFLDFDNIDAADRFVSYNPITSAFAAIGPAGTFNDGIVQTIAIAPNGDVYVGGSFTVGGGSVANYIAFWNGAAWAAVGVPGVANITIVNDLVFGLDGTLYIGGDFTDWAAIGANAAYIVKWDGAAYTALTTGTDGAVIAMDVAPDGTLYVGGDFADAGGVTVGDLASWDGSAWADVGGGIAGGGDVIGNIVAAKNNLIYIGGDFDTAGGVTVNNICIWNGITFAPLSSGTNGLVESLALGPDGVLYAGGSFTTAGGLATGERMAKWNGSSWGRIDVDLPETPTIEAIAIGNPNPIVNGSYDIWAGFTTTGVVYWGSSNIVANDGTVEVFPKFSLTRILTGTATWVMIRNETTGREIQFDFEILLGDTWTIDLQPREKKIVSDFSGTRPDAVLAGSDFGQFSLKPGNNIVTLYAIITGNAVLSAFFLWRDPYDGID